MASQAILVDVLFSSTSSNPFAVLFPKPDNGNGMNNFYKPLYDDSPSHFIFRLYNPMHSFLIVLLLYSLVAKVH